MARAPIIISNGGIVGILAKHSTDSEAEHKIKKNIKDLNNDTFDETKARSLSAASRIKWENNKRAPFIIWHIKGEDLTAFFEREYPNQNYELEKIQDPDLAEQY